MFKRSIWQILQKSVILVLVFLLASEPILVAAQPEQADPRQETIQSLTASGDVYLTNVAEALSLSAGLVNSVSAIQSTPLTQISENAILQTRANALKAAEASAVTLGSIDDLATSVQSLGDNLPVAFDPFQRAAEGLPQELRDDLTVEAGLTSTDVDAISAGMDDILLARQDMAANGMPAQIAAQLSQAGFTQSEIDQIAQVAGNRGLANTTLTTSLAQFRASQDEWANVRTQMLILNLQLMGYQIGVRQAGGIEPRAVTEAELQEIAEDELRLLVHVAHLQELWGSDPNLEIGEGDWWFIEHYAARAAERLDALIIETQNRGLVPDLFVLQEMRLLALSARNGDADYVKAELDGLGELLSFLVGDETFISRQREDLNGLTYVAARFVSYPSIREKVQWPLAETEKTYAAKRAKLRMDMVSVENLTPLYGVIAEQNEFNNMKTLLFMAGLPYFGQVAADIVAATTSILSQVTPENYVIWVTAILTGETDNPVLIAANIGWSLLPVLGVIPDIYSLAVDPSIFVKALSIVGIVGSIGDLIALIPFMQGVGGASFLGDAAAAVIKALFKQADVVFRAILNGLKLADAFDVIIDFLKVTAHYVGSSIGSHLDEAVQFLSGLFTGTKNLWGSFVAFVKRVGVDLLLKLGFDEGSLLVGRIINLGVDLSDEALVALKSVSDDLIAAGVDLSDEAAEGLGNAVDVLGESKARKLLTTCLVGAIQSHAKLARIVAIPVLAELCEEALRAYGKLSRSAQVGFDNIPIEKADEILRFGTHAQLEEVGLIAGRFSAEITAEASGGIFKLVDEGLSGFADNLVTGYSQDVAQKTLHVINNVPELWTEESYEGIARLMEVIRPDQNLRRVNEIVAQAGEIGPDFFWRIKLATDAEIPGLDSFLKPLNGSPASVKGANFELQTIEEEIGGFDRISVMELQIGPKGNRHIDAVTTSGEYFEFKSAATFDINEVVQLQYYLNYLPEDDILNLHYAFGVTQNESIKIAFYDAAKEIIGEVRASYLVDNNLHWLP